MNNDPGSSVMPFDTTSHAAARSDSAGNRAEATLTQISTSIFDYFFPLVDELTRCVPPNPFMTFISFTILTIQWFATAYFPFLDKTWDFSRFPDIILRDVTFLADFSCGNEDIYVSGIVDVIIPFLGLFIFLWSIWMISYYHWNKTFNRYHVKITQFVYTSVLPLLILPSSFNLGFAINYIDSEFTNYYLIITIFQALSLLFLISLFFLHLVCRASTPYLENTIMSSWDGRPIFFFILGNVFSTVSSRLIKNFPFWARHLLIVGYVGYTLFTLSKLLQFPMIKQTSQVMIFSNAIGAIFCSIFQLLNFSSAIRFFVPLGITLVLYPIVFIVFRIIRKNVLTKPDISTPNKAIRSLRIQIADHCAEFIKFRLIKNITSQCPRTSILAEIAQMLSFFPSESQMLNLYITLLTKRTDLRIDEWFMFYQIRRIHILRQTSNSKQLLDDLAFMKKCTKKTISAFSSFLPRAAEENSYLSIGTLFGLAKMKRETSAVCMETMEKYPNSHLLSYEYSRYIIECEADFKGGIDNYRKGIKLEQGRYTPVDAAFKSMINLFPNYLKKRILDFNGKTLINRRRERGRSASDSLHSTNDILDIDENEDIGARILRKPKLKMTLRRAVDNMKCKGKTILIISSLIRFVFVIACCSAMINTSTHYFRSREGVFNIIQHVGSLRVLIDNTLLRYCRLWVIKFGITPKRGKILRKLDVDEMCPHYINLSESTTDYLISSALESFYTSEQLDEALSSLPVKKTANLFEQPFPFRFCFGEHNEFTEDVNFTIHHVPVYFTSLALKYAANQDKIPPDEWHDEFEACEIVSNFNSIVNYLDSLSTMLLDIESKASEKFQRQAFFVYVILAPLVFVFLLVFHYIGYYDLLKGFHQIFDALIFLPTEVYKEISKPVFLLNQEEFLDGSQIVESQDYKRRLYLAVTIISILLTSATIVIFSYILCVYDKKFVYLNFWLDASSHRGPLILESVINTYFYVIYSNTKNGNSSNHADFLDHVYLAQSRLASIHHDLIWGYDNVISCNGFDPRLDSIHFDPMCKIEDNGTGLHKGYECLSADQLILTFSKVSVDLKKKMLDKDIKERDLLRTKEFIHYQHVSMTHLYARLMEAQEILYDGLNVQMKRLKNISLILSVIIIIIQCILFLIETFIGFQLNESFQIIRILISRIPTQFILKSPTLLELITGVEDSLKSDLLSPSKTALKRSNKIIFSINENLNLVTANTTALRVFNFTEEQFYGQSIQKFVTEESYQKMKTIIGQMFRGEIDHIQRLSFVGLSDELKEIYNEAFLEYIESDKIVVLCSSDTTQIQHNLDEIENVQQGIDVLMKKSIPLPILDQYKKDVNISFSLKTAAVLSMNIHNFVEYIASMSKTQVVHDLSIVFSTFDAIIADHYPNLIKYKIYGTCFYVAAGLFTSDLKAATTDIINFALECIQSLEDINQMIDSSLYASIGINAGGSLTAGVMGKESLLFEIVGETLTATHMLMNVTGDNKVSISQEAYSIVKDDPHFVFQEAGKIKLCCKSDTLQSYYDVTLSEEK